MIQWPNQLFSRYFNLDISNISLSQCFSQFHVVQNNKVWLYILLIFDRFRGFLVWRCFQFHSKNACCCIKVKSQGHTVCFFITRKHDITSPKISYFCLNMLTSFFLLSTQIKELKPCLLMEKVQFLLNLLNGWRMRTADYKWPLCWP